jgi:ABC-2 type transport system ATP-binding protein
MDEAEYCHRVSIMRNGRVVAVDAPNALKQRLGKSSMQEVFVEIVEGKVADALE